MTSTNPIKVYIPRDTTTLALGGEKVARLITEAAQAHQSANPEQQIEIVRNGSRGVFWLEPMVEVETHKAVLPMVRLTPVMLNLWSPLACSVVSNPTNCLWVSRKNYLT